MIVTLLVVMSLIVIYTFIILKGISSLGKVLLFFMVSTLLHEGFIITETNFGFIERDKELSKWLALVIYGIFWNPVLISLVTLKIWKSPFCKAKKTFFYTSLVLFLTGAEAIWKLLGYIHFIHWNLFYTTLRYTLVIVLILFFLFWVDKKVIKV